MDDSVIICGSTPSPLKRNKKKKVNRKSLRSSRNDCSAIGNESPPRLSVITRQNILDTVYESPLAHFRRNVNLDTRSNMINANEVETSSTNDKKRQQETFDESVMVLNDTIPNSVIEVGFSDEDTNDAMEVTENTDSRQNKRRMSNRLKNRCPDKILLNTKVGGKKKISPVKTKNLKRQKNTIVKHKSNTILNRKIAKAAALTFASTNDENRNRQIMEISEGSEDENRVNARTETASDEEQQEDIEVVWASVAPVTNTAISLLDDDQSTSRSKQARERSFVVDREPTLSNLIFNDQQGCLQTKKGKRLTTKGKSKTKKDEKQEKQERKKKHKHRLREIVIDGCNVAMSHKAGTKNFSEKGLKMVIDYFKERGHNVKAFLPQFTRTRDRELLEQLHKEGTVVFTPSRKIGGKHIIPYDDRFILEYATQCDGIVVSSDQYRDLWQEKPQWRNTIENRLIAPTFVGDYLMFPEDPLGRTGPKLDDFLRH